MEHKTETYYDYDLQTWIVDGIVAPDGHSPFDPTCPACNLHGMTAAEARRAAPSIPGLAWLGLPDQREEV